MKPDANAKSNKKLDFEPLKGKQYAMGMGEPYSMVYFHKDNDIKSAVEWLKYYLEMYNTKSYPEWDETLDKLQDEYFDTIDNETRLIYWFPMFLTDKAFEDVIEK